MSERLRILVLYDEYSTHTPNVLEHLQSLKLFSRHEVYYGARGLRPNVDLAAFDVVIIHYSVRICFDYLSPFYVEALPAFQGLKLLFIQDEYDRTEITRSWIERLGIQVVFTCVPPEYVEQVYPRARFPRTEFITTLTGYVPSRYEQWSEAAPLAARKIAIGYRGRPLPYWYGQLGQEKQNIGRRMKELCLSRGIPCDIEWGEEQRIYGDGWYQFLMSARATLGTESGSNVFDDYGEIQAAIRAELARNPAIGFEEVFEKYLAQHEGRVRMNQISPRVFEAIAVRTGSILFEGEYSGVVKPWEHYLPLQKDFGNVDQVLDKLLDDEFMEAMIERAHRDVIRGGRYSFPNAIQGFDAVIDRLGRRVRRMDPLTTLLAMPSGGRPVLPQFNRDYQVIDLVTSEPLLAEEAHRFLSEQLPPAKELFLAAWKLLPPGARNVIRPAVPTVRPFVRKLWRG